MFWKIAAIVVVIFAVLVFWYNYELPTAPCEVDSEKAGSWYTASPNGSYFAYTSHDGPVEVLCLSGSTVMDNPVELLRDHGGFITSISWNEASSRFLFTLMPGRKADERPSDRLGIANIDGTVHFVEIATEKPVWFSSFGQFSPDERRIAIAAYTDPDPRPDIWIIDTTTASVTTIVGSNEGNSRPIWLDNDHIQYEELQKVIIVAPVE